MHCLNPPIIYSFELQYCRKLKLSLLFRSYKFVIPLIYHNVYRSGGTFSHEATSTTAVVNLREGVVTKHELYPPQSNFLFQTVLWTASWIGSVHSNMYAYVAKLWRFRLLPRSKFESNCSHLNQETKMTTLTKYFLFTFGLLTNITIAVKW